ncbi:putative B9 domain-containing protein 1 [Monocercomonoides exilis]|uniref:putative B9 domain-containing protein 1 n=1 Tax=Monocercomonoides exilis TaxID=2049356 RepID=UPI003559CC6D|nr:putative B9 domain-containing protein 1 [Monocercomonoides exilis]|eukprot:MONOS_6001.1-p1 / transcript=MONOS_6001.1 / gene=MONOS_6001 / organism=Monocercomonoides_exilis_PA203 / gene_product=B9 domain-containing protein 1 / transcript_product=B9 domain-containing protein 1 / location=Mono_scaffold00182:95707-96608(+) / protein_length=185 / sequence_SO=supercontig / SO=protein_coding / is_pseudo=false
MVEDQNMSTPNDGDESAPNIIPTGKFQLYVNGSLESATLSGYDGVHATYSIRKGDGWEFISGVDTGGTQITAKAPSGPNRTTFVWNFPIELLLSSNTPSGWPQFVVNVYGLDLFGRDTLIGTGSTHLPIGPGAYPEFTDPFFSAMSLPRHVARTTSSGVVRVVFNIVVRNMSSCGYSISGEEYSI